MNSNNRSRFFQKWFRSEKSNRVCKRNDSAKSSPMGYENLEARQLLASSPAGDMVMQWNEWTLNAIRVSNTPPPVAARAMAIVHTAIFDAVNSIYNEYTPYATMAAVHPKASADAAVAAAAERALSRLFPQFAAGMGEVLRQSLLSVPDGIREDQGVAVGRFVADKILAMRAGDGWDAVPPVNPAASPALPKPGEWRPTPPGFAPPAFPLFGYVTPWAMESGSQFRAVTPPDLTSERYTIDYNMVKDLGAINSTTRTAAQTEVAWIWAGGPGTATPPGQWNMIAQDLAASQGNSLYENARMFAMLNVSLADAAISAWDTKYEFDLWRPVTAINQGDLDGNPATEKDAAWEPLLNTPNFPTYTSGHSTFSGAGSAALAGFFGTDSLDFKLVSEVPGVSTRYFDSLAWAAREAGFSRIFGGIHFNCDNVEALKAGRGIGDLVSSTLMQKQTNVVAGVNGHQLIVTGTTANDNIYVYRNGSDLVVRNHGQFVGRFSTNGIYNVVTNGSYGNDRINVANNVPMTTEQFGGEGNDRIFGSNNMNWLYGEGGDDELFGGSSSDVLIDGAGNDRLFGLGGNDYLDGGEGWNWVYGGVGDDALYGVRNKDRLFGGAGNNQVNWR